MEQEQTHALFFVLFPPYQLIHGCHHWPAQSLFSISMKSFSSDWRWGCCYRITKASKESIKKNTSTWSNNCKNFGLQPQQRKTYHHDTTPHHALHSATTASHPVQSLFQLPQTRRDSTRVRTEVKGHSPLLHTHTSVHTNTSVHRHAYTNAGRYVSDWWVRLSQTAKSE